MYEPQLPADIIICCPDYCCDDLAERPTMLLLLGERPDEGEALKQKLAPHREERELLKQSF